MQRERALAEAEGRARENRENEDINRRALAQRLEEERKKVVEAIDTTFRCRPALPWQQAGSLSSMKPCCSRMLPTKSWLVIYEEQDVSVCSCCGYEHFRSRGLTLVTQATGAH